MSLWRGHVDSLAGVGRVGLSPVMPLLRELAKQFALGIAALLESKDLVCGGNKLLGKLDYRRVGPDRPSGYDAVVSGAGERMAVHCPQQHRLVLPARK